MRNIKKILTVLLVGCLLSVFVVGCDNKPVYPVDLKAEMRDNDSSVLKKYPKDATVDVDLNDFLCTLIFSDGSESVIPSSEVANYAIVTYENGEVKVQFTYVCDEEKLQKEFNEYKEASNNKEELKKNAATNWNNMTDAEKKVVWKNSDDSEKEALVKQIYANEINSTDAIGDVPVEMLSDSGKEQFTMQPTLTWETRYDYRINAITSTMDINTPRGGTEAKKTQSQLDKDAAILAASFVIRGYLAYADVLPSGLNEELLKEELVKQKTYYYISTLNMSLI